MPLHVVSVVEKLLLLTLEFTVDLGSYFFAMVKDYGFLFVNSNQYIRVKI
jgi:hypothetical protein